jgi:hypothetical protein
MQPLFSFVLESRHGRSPAQRQRHSPSRADRAAASLSYEPHFVLDAVRREDKADAVAEVLVGDGIVKNAKGRRHFRAAAHDVSRARWQARDRGPRRRRAR